ncbi:MAG: hypothetical protein A2020_02975 [Lentisphaerae bacterium GWF2_45_14]|nr:MAG: hypothetical protein A2020_02975 [Lentisphaerae bacterium GWF2_45_14]
MDGRFEEQSELLGTHTNCIYAMSSDVFKFRPVSVVPLRAFMFSAGTWSELVFPVTQKIVRIGSSKCETDILIEDQSIAPVQLVLRRIGRRWFVFDSGETPLALFNGFKKRQAALDEGMKIFIELGGIVFLFCVGEQGIAPVPEAGQSVKNSFKLSFDGSRAEFSFAFQALIGLDALCDINVGNSAFYALVFYEQNGGFYLYSPFGCGDGPANSSGEKYLNLRDGTIFMAGEENIIFNSDFGAHYPPGALLMKDTTRSSLVLVELDDMDNVVNKLMLPDKGRSLFVGRNPGNYFMIGGRKISKKHAQIMTGAANICVIDNSSTNGTYVNGERIEKKVVGLGDSIGFGDRFFILTCAE